jgi:type I restriction enzyme S subunit
VSFKPYPKYKESSVEWLGRVPEHWEVRRLGFHFDERREKVSDKDYPPLSVTKNGIVPQLETAAKTDDGDNRKLVRVSDFVINSRSDRKGSAGVSEADGSVSLICTVLSPRTNVRPSFVHHLLRSVPFQEEYYRYGKGIVADLWSTNFGEMRNILLAMPPVGEQASIATFLDHETAKIDALIIEQQRLIELLQEKRQAVISRAVTKGLNPDAPMKDSGIEWLGEVPEHWGAMTVRRILARVEQGWSPECFAHPADNDEWGVVKTGCVNRGVFNETDNKALPGSLAPLPEYEIQAGDLLMSRANGSPELVGSTAYVEHVRSRLMLSDKIFRLHPSPIVTHRYFAVLFNAPVMRLQIERAISGAEGLANNLPQSALKSFFCVVPPVEEQNAIVSYVSSRLAEFGQLSGESLRAIALLQERRSALISAAVTGQIDVRGFYAGGGSEAA